MRQQDRKKWEEGQKARVPAFPPRRKCPPPWRLQRPPLMLRPRVCMEVRNWEWAARVMRLAWDSEPGRDRHRHRHQHRRTTGMDLAQAQAQPRAPFPGPTQPATQARADPDSYPRSSDCMCPARYTRSTTRSGAPARLAAMLARVQLLAPAGGLARHGYSMRIARQGWMRRGWLRAFEVEEEHVLSRLDVHDFLFLQHGSTRFAALLRVRTYPPGAGCLTLIFSPLYFLFLSSTSIFPSVSSRIPPPFPFPFTVSHSILSTSSPARTSVSHFQLIEPYSTPL